MKRKIIAFIAVVCLIGVFWNDIFPTYAINENGEIVVVDDGVIVSEDSTTAEPDEEQQIPSDSIEGEEEAAAGEEVTESEADESGANEDVIPGEGTESNVQEEEVTIEFSVAAIMAAGVEDPILAQAIYDSILEDPDNFTGDNTLTDHNFSSLEELLNNFNGELKASNLGITNINGIRLMKSCSKWDLSNNAIEDITPISGMAEDTTNWSQYTNAEKKYYGTYGSNLVIDINGNPIVSFPRWLEGRTKIDPALTSNRVYLDEEYVRFEHNGQNDFITSFKIDPGVYVSGERVILRESDACIYDDYSTGAVLSPFHGGATDELGVEGIKRSGVVEIWYAAEEIERMTFGYVNSTIRDYVLENTQNIGWVKTVSIELYNKVEEDTMDTKGELTFVKTGDDDGRAKAGAHYSLYKTTAGAADQLIGNYVTEGAEGRIVVTELEVGDYYLVETKAPEGYELNPEPIHFAIQPAALNITGGAGQTITTYDQGEKTVAGNSVYMLSGDSEDDAVRLVKSAGAVVKSVTVSWTEGLGQAGYLTFYEGDVVAAAEAKIAECRKAYQDVTVSAEFVVSKELTQGNQPKPVTFRLEAVKGLTNAEGTADYSSALKKDQFKFKLEAAEGTPALPEGYQKVVGNKADGSILFEEITVGSEITAATPKVNGNYEYRYLITEEESTDSKYSSDPEPCSVIVEVGKLGGDGSCQEQLVVKSITYEKYNVKTDQTDIYKETYLYDDMAKLTEIKGEGEGSGNQFINTYKSFEAVIPFEAEKILVDSEGSRLSMTAGQFKFKLEAKVGKTDKNGVATPALPEGYENIALNDENGKVVFASITVGSEITPEQENQSKDGKFTYYYTLTEATADGNTLEYDYDDTVYDIEVTVDRNDPENPVIQYYVDGKPAVKAEFTNTYRPVSAPAMFDFDFPAMKRLVMNRPDEARGTETEEELTVPEGEFLFIAEVFNAAGESVSIQPYTNIENGIIEFRNIVLGDDIIYGSVPDDGDYYTYTCKFYEDSSNPKAYYVYDMNSYELVIKIGRVGGTGENKDYLEVKEVSYDEQIVPHDGIGIEFENIYIAPEPVTIQLEHAIKVLKDESGKELDMPAGKFWFEVRTASVNTPLLKEPIKAANDAEGRVYFDAFTIGDEIVPASENYNPNTKCYEYKYAVVEIPGSDAAYTYDTAEYEVLVEIRRNEDTGALEVKDITYIKNQKPVDELVFTNVYETPESAEIQLKATKILKNKDGKPITAPADTFIFEVCDAEGNVIGTASNDEQGIVSFDMITIGEDVTIETPVNDAGNYEYRYFITETDMKLPDYICDDARYEVVIEAKNIEGQLTPIRVTYYKDGEPAGENEVVNQGGVYDLQTEEKLLFTNTYLTPDPVEIQLEALKKLIDKRGNDLADELEESEFLFKITADKETTPELPEGYVDIVVNDAEGRVVFAPISVGGDITPGKPVNADGFYEYHYTIEEVAGGDKQIAYDASVYEVTVLLKKENDKLLVEDIIYAKNDKVSEDGAVFKNIKLPKTPETPKNPETPETPTTPSSESPMTGDYNTVLLWAMMMLLGMAGVLSGLKKIRK